MRKKSIMRSICMLLATTMVVSMLVLNVGVKEDTNVASALVLPSGFNIFEKISDIDTSNFSFRNVPDIATATDIIFVNTPANDGRVWTDKSVNADQAFIYDTSGGVAATVQAPENEFLVTLSALSQSINTSEIIVEPSDTVFIIDVSGSMVSNTVPGDGRSRLAVVVDALNDAIVMLMNANTDNRVSVVIYGGQSVSSQNQAKTYPVLPLGRYVITPPIFSVNGSTVTVNSAIANPLQRTFTAEGGTPTQLGMRRGADMLLAVPEGLGPSGNGTDFDTGTPDPSNPGSNIIVTRKPNIILMTDGEPTYAWLDHTMSNFSNWQGVTTTANWYDVGNGSAGDMGLTTLTVMTAAYVKQQVRDHYYGTITDKPQNASRNVGFYTLGLGVNSSIANGMLDPYGKSASGLPNAQLVTQTVGTTTYRMIDALNSFVTPPPTPPTSGQFPYLQRGSGTNRLMTTTTNTGSYVSTCNYDTMSFTAMDKAGLDDAFNQITQQIVTQGNYSTNTSGDPQFDGYLAFSDVIGEYMEFTGFNGVWYNNINYNANTFATAMATPGSPGWNLFKENISNHLTYPGDIPIDPTEIEALIQANITAGNLYAGANSRFIYYADESRDYVNSLDASSNLINEAAAISAGASVRVELYTVQGVATDALDHTTPTDLMYLVFQVVTILQDGKFRQTNSPATGDEYLVSDLKKGDQIIRWYIPAALIPLREVRQVFQADNVTPEKDDFGFDVIQVSEAVPLRVIYSVAPNVDKIKSGLTALYSGVNKAPEQNSYYFYTNRWRGMDGTVVSNAPPYDQNNMSLASFVADEKNPFYVNDLSRDTIQKSPNPTGPTGTSPWQWRNSRFTASPTVQVQNLGNNGRIMIQSQVPLNITKTFNFDAATGLTLPDDVDSGKISMIYFTIIGLDNTAPPTGPLEIFRRVIPLSDFTYIGNNQYQYPTINVPPGTYVITESGGYALGYNYTPNMPVAGKYPNPFVSPPYNINLSNIYTGTGIAPPGIYLKKTFHGLTLTELAASVPDFSITLNYDDNGTDVLIGTYNKADFGPPMGDPQFGIHITKDDNDNPLQAGWYTFTEDIPSLSPDFILTVTPDRFELTQDDIDNGRGVLFVISNVYNPPPPPPTYSVNIVKTIRNTNTAVNPSVPVPNGLVFKVEGIPDTPTAGYLQMISYPGDMANLPLTGLIDGQYRISEFGGSADGFNDPSVSINGTPGSSMTFTLPGSTDPITFTFTNTYTPIPPPPPSGSLLVRKLLNFPAGTTEAQKQQSLQQLRDQGFEIVVTGPAGFNEKIDLDTAIAGAVFKNITAGVYTFDENRASLPNFSFSSDPALPFTRNITPDSLDAVTVEITNIYTNVPPGPPPPESLVVRKTLNFPAGTTETQRQQYLQQLRDQGFEIVITGPNGFNAKIGLDAAIAGAVFENVDQGVYTFDENNAVLPGLNFISNPVMPFTRTVSPNADNAVTVEIRNTYTTGPPPPPPPPAPQTGVDRNIFIPIIILLLGSIWITGAEVIRRKINK